MTEDGMTEKTQAVRRNEGYEDLRDLLDIFEEMGEVEHIDGADWNLEVGAISEMTAAARPGFSSPSHVARHVVYSDWTSKAACT